MEQLAIMQEYLNVYTPVLPGGDAGDRSSSVPPLASSESSLGVVAGEVMVMVVVVMVAVVVGQVGKEERMEEL